MNFEHALEAMTQGKKVNRKVWTDMVYYLEDKCIKSFNKVNKELDAIAFLSTETILANDWEIYEEPQKETEMTAWHAIEVLETVRRACKLIPDIDEAIDFAIETIDKQNQPEHKCNACHCKEKSVFTTEELVETASKIIDFMHWLTGDDDDE